MSRYDEIKTMAREQHHNMAGTTPYRLSHHKALCYGAEWADKTMIEKASNWLRLNITDYIRWDYDGKIDIDKLIDDFTKAMKK